jgi:D-alanyl-D-alanine carboxypeptidase
MHILIAEKTMANESPELQEAMQAFRNAMLGISEEAEKSKTGLKAFGTASAQAAKDLTKGIGSLAMQVGRGNTEFKSLNTVVDITTNALGGMAKAIPFAGEAVNAGLRAAAEGAKFMLEQMDQTAKAFNDLGRVGGLTASGMSGLQKQFVQSGLSLNSFTKIVGDNSVAMARFRGMTGEGAEEFTRMTGALAQGDMTLRRLGMSADQIGESTAAFITQQTRLGRSQAMGTTELINGTKQYAMELDLLSKVTGLSREAIQKQQDAALSESRFRANYEELMSQGRVKEAKALMDLQTRMSTFGEEMGQGTRDLISGAANTDAARKMMASTGGAAADIIARLKDGQIDQNQAQIELQAAMRRNREAQMMNAKFVDRASSAFQDFGQVADFTNQDFSQGFEKAKRTQDAQVKSQDKLTEDTVKAQSNMEQMNREMQKLGFTFLPNAATAVNKVTEAMKGMVQFINEKVLGKPKERATGGGGGGGTMDGFDIMGNAGGAGGGGGPPEVKPEDYIKFTGGTGDKAHFDQLEPGVRSQFMQMAMAYNQMTGKKLQVNSAFRSPEEQAAVNSGANPKAAPGMSLHNIGRAVDINSDQRADLERLGLLSQYGFRPLAGDPPHISAASGAILSGPMSGYKPNLTMHGTEAIVPLNSPAGQAATNMFDNGLMAAQLDKLDEMVSILKNQLSVSTKIMQYSS